MSRILRPTSNFRSSPLTLHFRISFSFYRLLWSSTFFFFNDTATTEIYTLSLHDALPISEVQRGDDVGRTAAFGHPRRGGGDRDRGRFIVGDVDGGAAAGGGRGGGADQAQRLTREALQEVGQAHVFSSGHQRNRMRAFSFS